MRVKNKNNKMKRGFGLIEMSIAIVLVSAIVGSMLFIFNQGYILLRKTRMQTIAFFLAQGKMEELSDPSNTALFSNPSSLSELKGPLTDPLFSIFQRRVDVANNYLGYPDLTKISVTIYWPGQYAEQSVTLESLIANF